ncbi:hypothetical protein BSPCLSOX_2220 [uncultured Gammaproteobacteria bacterium]|nr:hypothetical protein BSPCLSOX_2220 [uncultured Gammaproteobacteria bacterium]
MHLGDSRLQSGVCCCLNFFSCDLHLGDSRLQYKSRVGKWT